MNENAKNAWMKLVNKHKKRQKGLPVLSTLNTNAGNVEHNINMFNMMQPSGSITVDASNGNISSGEFSGGMGESFVKENFISLNLEEKFDMNKKTIDLEYDDIIIDVETDRGRSSSEITINWTYSISEDDVKDFFWVHDNLLTDLLPENASDEEFYSTIENNLDYLVDKYNNELKEYYLEDAIDDAIENYVYNEYDPREDPDVAYEEARDRALFDDEFDMSMRTLL